MMMNLIAMMRWSDGFERDAPAEIDQTENDLNWKILFLSITEYK